MLKLRQILPKGSALDLLLEKCDPLHRLQLIQVNDGALLMLCHECPYRYMLSPEEEKSVREEMEKQKIEI